MNSDQKKTVRNITLWNESRLDLFEITPPNKNFEFHGVIRFYHQDSSSDGKYATKCMRVSNTATTVDVIEILGEKFRSDMRMLSKPKYALYEVHANGEARKLKDNEYPLTVQLTWLKDDREGRFLFRNEDDKRPVHVGNGLYEESEDTIKGFKLTRNLTKKEKKQMKKKEKLAQKNKEDSKFFSQEESTAKQLFTEVPESTFTRTVSNPEAVMKKRREQKLQKRGAEQLKIYGNTINKEIPYKSLLLLPSDDTDTVIRDALDKYGLAKEKTIDYMLVQVVLPPGSNSDDCLEGGWGKETILSLDHCPLDIAQNWQPHQGTLVFQLRPSTAGYALRKKQKLASMSQDKEKNEKKVKAKQTETREKKLPTKSVDHNMEYENFSVSKQPKLLEIIGPEKILAHAIAPNVTEIGSDSRKASYGPFIELHPVPGLMMSHCVITNMDGVVTVTPHDNDGEVSVNGKIIQETTMLTHGADVWLGRRKHLVFCDSGKDLSFSQLKKRNLGDRPPLQAQQNVIDTVGQKDDSSSNTSSVTRHRHHSTISSGSSKSGLLSQAKGPFPEENAVQNLHTQHQYDKKQQNTHPQSLFSKSSSDKSLQHRTLPPQTAMVQPIQHSNQHRLPASLSFNQDTEESLIIQILSVHASALHFKLSPAYSIYLIQRHLVEANRSNMLPSLFYITDLLEHTIQLNSSSMSELSFWMANTSELLNFIRQDQDLVPLTTEIQDRFAKTVQSSFRHLVQCMQHTLIELMPAFLAESDEDLPGGNDVVDLKKQNRNTNDPTMYDILHMLSSAMSLLRRCRVNAALTIQLFSQLFHSVNMWLFNKLVDSTKARKFCSREWGMRIRARLAMVETWAEKQGLELAADCHLARITQATHLLQAPKNTEDDIAAISGTCFKLNSIQLRVLLSNYQPVEADGERLISSKLINHVVAAAKSSADELLLADGRDIQLEEDPDLQLPFLLPEDGYSCDVVHGVPSGLTEFLQLLEQKGLCTYTVETNASGHWTTHFQSILQQYKNVIKSSHNRETQQHKAEIIKINLQKQGGGMGLSIVAAQGIGQDSLGIYIRSVVKGGAADLDGRLEAGDQLLSVDGHSLIGVDQASAANMMKCTGPVVFLEIAKQGAVYHGLAKLLNQSSLQLKQMPQAYHHKNLQYAHTRPKSEGYSLPAHDISSSNSSIHSQIYGSNRALAVSPNVNNVQNAMPRLDKGSFIQHIQPISKNPAYSATSLENLPRQKEMPHKGSGHLSSNEIVATNKGIVSMQEPESPKTSHCVTTPPFTSPRNALCSSDAPVNTAITKNKHFQNYLDNPNYDQFPSPPPELLYENDIVNHPKSHIRESSPVMGPRSEHSAFSNLNPDHRKYKSASTLSKMDTNKEEASSDTIGKKVDRPSSAKKTEIARVAPTQKKKRSASPVASKSATLPRHFKSVAAKERDERESKEQSIQEQLNAQRDEEIEELSLRTNLTSFEQDRLKNLLREREFQAKIQVEKMKLFSDEDLSEEDYSVPDRPDRDRLIQIEGAHALRDAAAKLGSEKDDHVKWKEEQLQKKLEAETRAKLEAERREEKRKERERADQERINEKRKRELLQQEEKRKREEEQQRMLQKEQEWHMNYNNLQREEEEQRRRLDEIRKMREEEENQLRELQKKREAEAREESERELLEQKLSSGKPNKFSSSYKGYAAISYHPHSSADSETNVQVKKPSYKNYSSVSNISHSSMYNSKPMMRGQTKTSTRPVSDGLALGKIEDFNLSPPLESAGIVATSYNGRRPISYVSTTTTPTVIGSQELYNDPRSRREATLKRDQSVKRRGPDPSRLTFKDRQRLFQGGSSSPINKPKSSRKLLELEQSLGGQL